MILTLKTNSTIKVALSLYPPPLPPLKKKDLLPYFITQVAKFEAHPSRRSPPPSLSPSPPQNPTATATNIAPTTTFFVYKRHAASDGEIKGLFKRAIRTTGAAYILDFKDFPFCFSFLFFLSVDIPFSCCPCTHPLQVFEIRAWFARTLRYTLMTVTRSFIEKAVFLRFYNNRISFVYKSGIPKCLQKQNPQGSM